MDPDSDAASVVHRKRGIGPDSAVLLLVAIPVLLAASIAAIGMLVRRADAAEARAPLRRRIARTVAFVLGTVMVAAGLALGHTRGSNERPPPEWGERYDRD